jgi:hypothetical protein
VRRRRVAGGRASGSSVAGCRYLNRIAQLPSKLKAAAEGDLIEHTYWARFFGFREHRCTG